MSEQNVSKLQYIMPFANSFSVLEAPSGQSSCQFATMGDGTPAMGKRHKKTHGLCVRCNARAFHLQNKKCGRCGYPSKRIRKYNWSNKAKRRKTTGTGRCRHLRTLPRRFKNNFREGLTPAPRKKNSGN